MRPLRLLAFLLLVLLALPAVAFGVDAPPPNHTLALPADQLTVLVVGSLVPLITYLLNHYAPWCSEPVKGVVLVVAAAVAGALQKLLDTGSIPLNAQTAQLCFSAVVAALFAHQLLWKPSGISAKLKAGTNSG